MTKFEELEKIQDLKNNGAITDTEFEKEKQRILNTVNTSNTTNRTTSKKGTAKLFFTLTVVGIIIAIVLTIGYCYYRDNVWYDIYFDYTATKRSYDEYDKYSTLRGRKENKKELEEVDSKYKKANNILHTFEYGAWGTGGLTVAFLIIGIIFKVK